MKRKHFKGMTSFLTTIRIGGGAMIGMMSTLAYAGSPEVAPAAIEEEIEPAGNWVEFTVGGVAMNGSKAAFQQRAQQDGDFYGGISSMRWEQENDGIAWFLEGHLLFGNEDYDITLGAAKDDLGYLKAGFRQFRTWYNGTGGYLPDIPTGWRPLDDDQLRIDRGELWVEAGLRMENLPEITLGYVHQWRQGDKDSTMWGTAFPGGLQRGIIPGLYDIDETRDIVTLDIAHTLGNTDLGLGLRYEGVRNDNVRSALSANNTDTVFTTLTQRDVYEYDLFGGHLTSVSRFGERMMLSFGYSHTTMDTDIDGGQRGNTVAGVFTPVYNLITGGGDFIQNTANLNFWWNPIDDLVVVPSIRANWEEIEMDAIRFNTVDATTSGTPSTIRTNDNDMMDLSEELEIRYTGIENVVLYTSGEWRQGDSDRWLRNPVNGDYRFTDTNIHESKYIVGAKWYPCQGVSLSAQAFHRLFDEHFDHNISGGSFDAQLRNHEVETENANLRLTWRALPNLTLVSRYDYQRMTIQNQAFTDAFALVDTRLVTSADIERHVVSQSATWSATERLYLQGSLSWTSDETSTPANDFQPGYHVDWDNDYITASLSAGYALGKATDLQAGYHYFRADNYVNNALLTTPYGIAGEEHMFTVGLTHQINPNMIWNMRYGYFTSNDAAVGGNHDFDAHTISTGLQIRF